MVLTKQRDKFSSNSDTEIKDLSSEEISASDPVKSCSNLIWYDRRNSHGYMDVTSYTMTCAQLSLFLMRLSCFFQHLQRLVLELTDIFLRMLLHLVISALFRPLSLSLLCQNFHTLLFFVCLSSLQAHQDYS